MRSAFQILMDMALPERFGYLPSLACLTDSLTRWSNSAHSWLPWLLATPLTPSTFQLIHWTRGDALHVGFLDHGGQGHSAACWGSMSPENWLPWRSLGKTLLALHGVSIVRLRQPLRC